MEAAIAAGDLSLMSVSPIGQIRRAMSVRRKAELAQRALKARAFGVAADQADIAESVRP